MTFTFQTIGILHSPYQEKFAVPRQPNLVRHGYGELHFIAPFNNPDMVKGLEAFSHLWLMFVFNQTMDKPWHPTVRPPRLGGNKRLGVFATRSTFRPNPIGLSAVKLNDIIIDKHRVILQLADVDIVDNTPIIDIKPYVPYADSYPDAHAGFAQNKPSMMLNVEFSTLALHQLQAIIPSYPHIAMLITDVLAQDPRPAYKALATTIQHYGVKLYNYNVRFTVHEQTATVDSIDENSDKSSDSSI